ncbi:MAG: hypothetical protein AAFZ80_12245 [Cyanobacteria bacterium P01_A01_bin.105]
MADLTGSWLGTYWQSNEPTRFEATLAQARGSLSGRILDDGPLGEASLQGEVIGRQLTFIKRYLNNSNYSIRYTGTVSEDGNHISGQWFQNTRNSGSWEAQRNPNGLAKALKSFLEKRTPATMTPTN